MLFLDMDSHNGYNISIAENLVSREARVLFPQRKY